MFFEFVEGDWIFDHLDDTTIRSHRKYLIGSQYQGEILQFEDVVKLIDKLECELLLFEVILCLDYQMYKFPTSQVLVNRLLFNPLSHLGLTLSKHIFKFSLHLSQIYLFHLKILWCFFIQSWLSPHIIRIFKEFVW